MLRFGGLLVNLLEASQAPPLVEPLRVAQSSVGVRALLTMRVADVDQVCSALREIGVDLLNGPIDRPWDGEPRPLPILQAMPGEIAQMIERE